MKRAFTVVCFLLFSCSATEIKSIDRPDRGQVEQEFETPTQDTVSPQGIYSGIFPGGVTHTIEFRSNETFKHQHQKNNDPEVINRNSGTWSSVMGKIFLSQGGKNSFHIVFMAVGDTLYGVLVNGVKPSDSTKYSLVKQKPARETGHWQKEFAKGLLFAGLGNEPFWNIQIFEKQAKLEFMGSKPVILNSYQKKVSGDTTTYTFLRDSAIILRVFPEFCSDGMSDFIYPYKVRLRYNNEYFEGCGMSKEPLEEESED